MTPLDQLRLRLPAHDFDRLMQAAKPVAESPATPCLRTSRRSLANTKWSDLACCIGSLAKCSGAMMSLTNAELRHKNGKTRDGCEGVGHGGFCPIYPGRAGATSDEQCSEVHARGGHDWSP